MIIYLDKSGWERLRDQQPPEVQECNLHSHVIGLIIQVVAYTKSVFPQFTVLFPPIYCFHPCFFSQPILLYDSMIVGVLNSVIKTQVLTGFFRGLLKGRNYQVIFPFYKHPSYSHYQSIWREAHFAFLCFESKIFEILLWTQGL